MLIAKGLQLQGGESDHVMCYKNVLCCMQHKDFDISDQIHFIQQKRIDFLKTK